jgi:hypothetical protein
MAALMPAAPMDHLYAEGVVGDAHSLMEASIEDFEEQESRSPVFSDFRAEPAESESDDRSSLGLPWSPPGFRHRNANASGWFRQDPYGQYDLRPSMSPSRSRQASPEFFQDAREGDPDITIAVNTPLPAGADSPVRERSPEVEVQHDVKAEMEDPASTEAPNNCK